MVYLYKACVKGVRIRSMNADDVINAHYFRPTVPIRGGYFFKKIIINIMRNTKKLRILSIVSWLLPINMQLGFIFFVTFNREISITILICFFSFYRILRNRRETD